MQSAYEVEIYVKEHQRELRKMAQEVNYERKAQKASRFQLANLLRRAKTPGIRVTAENMTPASNAS